MLQAKYTHKCKMPVVRITCIIQSVSPIGIHFLISPTNGASRYSLFGDGRTVGCILLNVRTVSFKSSVKDSLIFFAEPDAKTASIISQSISDLCFIDSNS